MRKYIKNIIKFIINVIYPPKCAVCSNIIEFNIREGYLCKKCSEDIPFLKGKFCEKCGRPVEYGKLCLRCMEKSFAFDFGFSAFEYRLIKRSIARFKYKGIKKLGFYMAELMCIFLERNYPNVMNDIDIIIPVPIHSSKMKKRGFNQADIIGRFISEKYNIEYSDTVIERIKKTIPQSRLQPKEKIYNIKDAFAIKNTDIIQDKRIMIVDDIFTTGTTINECSKLLISSGAKSVVFFTFASS